MPLRRLRLSFASPLLLLSLSHAAAAQSQPAPSSLRGTVLDPAGAAVVGARITSVHEDRVPGASAVSDQRGEFTLLLESGRYTITVASDGFTPVSQAVSMPQTSPDPIKVVLPVPGVQEAVTVNAPRSYQVPSISATKTATPLIDVPQSVTVITDTLIKDQLMMSVGDVVRYVPGIAAHQGENNRDQIIVRGNSSSADFYVNGVRDDVQYYRDLYNLSRVEALKGANAMMFGRGGAGGVVNRVTKEAVFQPLREFSAQGGSYDNRRFAVDFDQPLNQTTALRVNGMYENSDSFRSFVGLERYGVSPTLTVMASDKTKIRVDYEYLHDTRVADRGITSYQGRPAKVAPSTYYGNPNDSHVGAEVNLASATVEHRSGTALIRNHTLFGDYDRGYQNYVPGAANAAGTQVTLTAYNNATTRNNLFNQTDLTFNALTGRLRHTLIAGLELGRQLTDNFRNTGFFNNTATSLLVPFGNPITSVPVTFRQSATDADNHLITNTASTYLQDQLELSQHLQLVGGLRFDHFDLTYNNNRNGDVLGRVDNLLSPRAGVVYKPAALLSVYGSYSMTYLPSSGDQFSSLTVITQQLEPEQIVNYEVGAKWDARPNLSVTTALYRLDRTNTRSTDPNDPTRIVQTGSQRTNGYELGINGRVTPSWSLAGGYAYQNAFVTSATAAAKAGQQVGQVPHPTVSLWNNYQFHPRLSAGLGILYRGDMFATIDNTVTVPGYVRADAAAFIALTRDVRVQFNVENLFDTAYFINADSNTNISPGSPRAVRVALTAGF